MEVRDSGLSLGGAAGLTEGVCPRRVAAWEPDFMGSNPSSAVDQLCDLEQVSQPLYTSLLVLK